MKHKLFKGETIEYNPPIINHNIFEKYGITDYIALRKNDNIMEFVEPYHNTFYHRFYKTANNLVFVQLYMSSTLKTYGLEGIQLTIINP